ncbi:lipoprotein insertase outer membrane protein LolB [Psychromonas sp.]|nr:lipoprotein insertase outer membrane protein LolB [Psychromonas sp.]
MKNFLLLFLIITLTGCSLLNNEDPETEQVQKVMSWEEHQKQLQALTTWSLTGKFAVFIGKERQTANLHWQQQQENYTIQLTSFIGTRILQIKKNQNGVEIINNDGEIFTGENATILIQELSPGLNLPISALQEWIKGNPSNATYQLNEQDQVINLIGQDIENAFWSVNYQQYQSFSGYQLPTKLNLTKNDIRVKIAINQWNLSK